MTAQATTSPFAFEFRSGRRCLLKRKQRRLKPSRSFSAKQVFTEHTSVLGKKFIKRKYFVKSTGNGCHHDPDKLKPIAEVSPYDEKTGKPVRHFFNNKAHDAYGNRLRTNVQYKAAKKAKAYYVNPDIFPFIEVARKAQKRKKGGGKIGKHRSEGREGLCCTLEGLFFSMDIHSFRIGRPNISDPKKFHYATNESIATQCGISPKRLQRNLELLEAAGMIQMKRQYVKLKDGGHVGKASAIWFTRAFIKAFGMMSSFNRTSQQLTKHSKKNAEQGIKTPEQIKAEATDMLCQAASQIVSKKQIRKSVKSLFDFIDSDESPPPRSH